MAPGKACNPESLGSRRGFFVPFACVKPIGRLKNSHHQNFRRGLHESVSVANTTTSAVTAP